MKNLNTSYQKNDDGIVEKIIHRPIDNLEVAYYDLRSVVPWDSQFGGKVVLNKSSLEGIFVNPPVISECQRYLVLGKYDPVNKKFSSQKDFKINVVQLNTGNIFESKRGLELVTVENMKNNKIIFHKACHTKDMNNQRELTFNQNNFNQVGTLNLAV